MTLCVCVCLCVLMQAPYIEVAEVAPHQWRGAFVLTDPLGQAVGVWTRTLLHAGLGNEVGTSL